MLSLTFATGPAPSQTASQTPIPLLTSERKASIESELTDAVIDRINEAGYREKLSAPVSVNVTLNVQSEEVVIDLGAALGPESQNLDAEDLREDLRELIYIKLHGDVLIKGVSYLYGGKDVYFYLPNDHIPEKDANTNVAPGETRLLVTAGHGVYYNHRYKDWRPQREVHNGILEDYITPTYAFEFRVIAPNRGTKVEFLDPRRLYDGLFPEATQLWRYMGARYHLKEWLPDRPDIWHSKPNSSDSLRERDEDINSRPLYANAMNASAAIHFHTNGGTPTARGARVYIQQGNGYGESRRFAEAVLCYMREQIKLSPKYPDFPVAPSVSTDDKGETRLAKMPSIIVELGFHTNPTDAAALLDPAYTNYALRGVEKGYRVFARGGTCEDFAVDTISSVIASDRNEAPIEIAFKGNPQFPVNVISEAIDCPTGWTCFGPKTVRFTEEIPSPLVSSMACRSKGETGTITWMTKLVDDDGIESEPARHFQTCIGPTEHDDLDSHLSDLSAADVMD